MIVHSCSIVGMRNIEDEQQVEFDEGVNVLMGDNGQGKTNLLESIYLCSIGKSFRGADDNEMICFERREGRVTVDYSDSLRRQSISMRLSRGRRRMVLHNGVRVERMSDMVGKLACVLFCPEHLSVVKDGPAARRNYLDIAISQLRPAYLSALQRYNKVLKQRNRLIKEAEHDRRTFDDTIDFWSMQLATEAAYISRARLNYIRQAREQVASFFSSMTDGTEVPELIYSGSSHDEEAMYDDLKAIEARYLQLLTSNHPREIGAGSTLWGPHKDDITILLNGHPARVYASQGQQRSIALAMKLSEGEISRAARGEAPVMLLDDVLSELDAGRREYLLKNIFGWQVIMTCCGDVPLDRGAKVLHVTGGRYF